MDIRTLSDFRRAMRAGPYAWPGGYPVYFVTADGAALSFQAARDNRREILDAIASDDNGGGWRVVGADLALEGPLFCDHTGQPIETAYGDVDSD